MFYLKPLILLFYIFAHTTCLAHAKPSLISLDFQDLEVRKALQILAKFIGSNVLIEDTVQGKVSLHLDKVPPEEAIQAILHMKGLIQQRIGATWVIQPQTQVSTSNVSPSKASLEKKRFIIKHRQAKEIATLFLESQTKQNAPKLIVDSRSNSLWLQDTAERIGDLEQIIHWFDHPIQQVLIEARIVSVSRDYNQAIGTQLGLKPSSSHVASSDNDQEPIDATTRESSTKLPQATNTFTPELHFNVPVNSIFPQVSSFQFNNTQLLDLELSALENEGNARILSKPRLVTTDRETAVIEAGSEIPYAEKTRYATSSISFKKAVLSLKVTPEITPTRKILLKLHIVHNKPGTFQIAQTPSIETQELKTQVLIKTGETIVLGGVYENIRQNSIKRLPVVGKIPIIGYLFSHRMQIEKSTELLIFVTPSLHYNTKAPSFEMGSKND